MSNWITDRLPEDGITVLIRMDNRDVPLELGYCCEGKWRFLHGERRPDRYIEGWMSLEDARRILG